MNVMKISTDYEFTFIDYKKYEELREKMSELTHYYDDKPVKRRYFVNMNKDSTNGTSIFYSASDVAELLGISVGHAYKVIKNLNGQLEKRGLLVINGRVSKKYLIEKCYGAEQMLKDKGR